MSERHARKLRHSEGECRKWCLTDPIISEPTDSDRRYWLCRFSDAEIAELASAFFRQPADLAAVADWRQRLEAAVQ